MPPRCHPDCRSAGAPTGNILASDLSNLRGCCIADQAARTWVPCREDREDFDLKAAEGNTGKRGRPEGAGGGGGGGKRVFANNLAEETTWQALKDYFKQAGPVAHADVLAVCLVCFHDLVSKPKEIFGDAEMVYVCLHRASQLH